VIEGENMKIVNLELKNFRGIEEANIEFNGNSAIIYGINGMGKSTILHACNLLFFRVFKSLTDSNLGHQEDFRIAESDIKNGEDNAKIQVEIQLGKERYTYYRTAERGGNRRHATKGLKELTSEMQKRYIGRFQIIKDEDMESEQKVKLLRVSDDKNMPIYATYSVNRYVTDRIEKQEKKEKLEGKMEALRDIFNPTINFNLFFEWFRGRQEYEYSERIEKDDFEDAQLSAVRHAVLSILDNDFTDIRIKISDEEARMIAVKHGTELSVSQLSEGEKCILAMTGDLARKLAIANPQRQNPLEGEGIVLIDEVDLHLHPTWQGKIMHLLMNTFPNIQFIVTTHSPKILGEITDEAGIFEIYEDEDIKVRKRPSMSGWDINHIMSEFMHTETLNQKTRILIDQMHEHIDSGDFDGAEELADELAEMTDELNVEVVRARTLIHKRKQYEIYRKKQ
jgi:predicted ATP-binding protein involved in virulence